MKKVLFIMFIFVFLYIITKEDYVNIPSESIRFRIVANSNSSEDINIKFLIVEKLNDFFNTKNNIEDTREYLIKNKSEINHIIERVFKDNNYYKKYKIDFGYNYFPRKEFENVIYPEGNYESLLITIGEGKGDNFWCVLFPPLCLMEVENTKDVTYKLKIKEVIDKAMNKK